MHARAKELISPAGWKGPAYYYILLLLAAAVPLSEFATSVSLFLLLFVWLGYGNHHEKGTNALVRSFNGFWRKLREAFSNPVVAVLTAVWILHAVGLLWSANLSYGWADLRVKLPLLALPVLLFTFPPISGRQLKNIFIVFVLAIIAGTLIGVYLYFTGNSYDPRTLSPFVSHIRLSLMIVFAVVLLLDNHAFFEKWVSWPAAGWLLLFLVLQRSLTGLGILFITGAVLGFIYAVRSRKIWVTAALLAFVLLAGGWVVRTFQHEMRLLTVAGKTDPALLPQKSAAGTPYIHDTVGYVIEHCRYIGLSIAPGEIDRAWSRVSRFDINGWDNRGQDLRTTLYRYMNAYDLPKDSVGIAGLSPTDIRNIENGIANPRETRTLAVGHRIGQTAMGIVNYRKFNHFSASPLVQKWIYWNTAADIIRRHPLAGTGTGDVQDAFNEWYDDSEMEIAPVYRVRSHNQFLTVAVALGIPAMLYFIFSMVWPGIRTAKFRYTPYLAFTLIMVLSMLTEDTLETQTGVTLFAFFNSLLLFHSQNVPRAVIQEKA